MMASSLKPEAPAKEVPGFPSLALQASMIPLHLNASSHSHAPRENAHLGRSASLGTEATQSVENLRSHAERGNE